MTGGICKFYKEEAEIQTHFLMDCRAIIQIFRKYLSFGGTSLELVAVLRDLKETKSEVVL